MREEVRGGVWIGRTRHLAERVQPLGHGCEREDPVIGVIMQRPLPGEIAREQQAPRRAVPQGESEITHDPPQRALVPAQQRVRQQSGVRHPPAKQTGPSR